MTTTTAPPPAARGSVSGGHPAPRYRKFLGLGREMWLQYAVVIFLAIFVLAPVVPTLYQSLLDRPLYEAGGVLSLDNYVRLFTEAGFGEVALNTLLFAGLTTILTLLLAVPMAVVVVRTKMPGGGVLSAAMQWPFFISSLILGFGWIMMYGPSGFVSIKVQQVLGDLPWNLYSIPGMALTEAVALAPIAYTFCANALRQSDASLESAAQVCGAGPLRIIFQVILPMLRPPIVYSSILVISMSVETLSVPLLYGQPVNIQVFSTFLYKNGLQSINPDYGVLGAASAIILVVTIGLVALQAKLLKDAQRFVSVRGKATRPRLLDLGWLKWISLCAIVFYVTMGALLPILGLIMRSFTLVFSPLQSPLKSLTMNNYDRVFTYAAYVQSIKNSLIVAALGAVLVSFVALMAVMVARRSTFRFRRAAEYLALAPQAMPGIIVGIGFFWAFAYAPFGTRPVDPGHAVGAHHRVRLTRSAKRFRVTGAVDHADRPGTRQRRPGGWCGLGQDVLADPVAAADPGVRGCTHPHFRDDAQGVFARCVPCLCGQQHHRHDDARTVGAGQYRLGRRARQHSDRDHCGLRGARRTSPERTQNRCLT